VLIEVEAGLIDAALAARQDARPADGKAVHERLRDVPWGYPQRCQPRGNRASLADAVS
jgi:hypothetical protein